MRVPRARCLHLELGVRVARHPRHGNANAADRPTTKTTLLSATLHSSSTLLLLQRLALSSFATSPFCGAPLHLALPHRHYSAPPHLARHHCAAAPPRLTFLAARFILLRNSRPRTLPTGARLSERLKPSRHATFAAYTSTLSATHTRTVFIAQHHVRARSSLVQEEGGYSWREGPCGLATHGLSQDALWPRRCRRLEYVLPFHLPFSSSLQLTFHCHSS
jgi:hypothetical protein